MRIIIETQVKTGKDTIVMINVQDTNSMIAKNIKGATIASLQPFVDEINSLMSPTAEEIAAKKAILQETIDKATAELQTIDAVSAKLTQVKVTN